LTFEVERNEVRHGGRALIIVPDVRTRNVERRDKDAREDEARGLALAIGLVVVDVETVGIRAANPASLFGKGQVERIANNVRATEVELVIIDGPLTAIQQRNLEKALACKVIDRTGLILEIFGERALTAEGRLQVELAHLDYQQGRLVRSWTHLERQRGGFGFLGGPGETQIEADRRMIRDRMARIRRSLEDVRKTRALHRQRRHRAPWPVVALVGYTNAGKSTLFNRLTASNVVAEDQLFATLDPTMREIQLPGIGKAILSDTVGFVADLPTQLIAAFRATLEEVLAADLLLHVHDCAHPESEEQARNVLAVLADLGVDIAGSATTSSDNVAHTEFYESGRPITILNVYNKTDLLDEEEQDRMRVSAAREGAYAISAHTGEGVDALLDRLGAVLGGAIVERNVRVAPEDGATRAWLYSNARILGVSQDTDGAATFHVGLTAKNNTRLSNRLAALS
jgi:GTP-binding protein HflX